MLAHRVYIQIEDPSNIDYDPSRNAITGSVDFIVDTLDRFSEMGVGDLSIIPGRDDASSLRTVEVLIEHVLPQLSWYP